MIRKAIRADIPAVARAQVASWHGVYRGLIPDEVIDRLTVERRIDQWTPFFDRGPRDETLLVAEHDDAVVGMASLAPSGDEDASSAVGEVKAIYVTPDHWGHGHGRRLIAASHAWLVGRGFGEATLWVLEGNQRARRFYEAAGWWLDGAAKDEEMFGALLPEVRYRVAFAGVKPRSTVTSL